VEVSVSGGDGDSHTLIFLFLHLRHPARDFLWERRGGMTEGEQRKFMGVDSRVVN
jgi:hypothetical protein